MPSELEKSYELIGRIFEKLIQSGLRAQDLDAFDFLRGSRASNSEEAELFQDVMYFLRQENLIRTTAANPIRDNTAYFYGAQLTSYGLAAIESRRFEGGTTVRDTVEEKKGELSSATYGKIGSFVGGMIGGATKALGS